jgi:hypothetical protein
MKPYLLDAESLSRVDSEPVRWLWEPYIPRGKLVLLDGDPRVGKSFIAIDLAARLSRGSTLPDGKPGRDPHTTLILSAEDGVADTIRPRAEAAGADLDRIKAIRAFGDVGIHFPRDTQALSLLIMETRADLVIIDPLMAFLHRHDKPCRFESVASPVNQLGEIAAETDCTILLIRHLRKSLHDKSIYRGLGSVGIIGAARVALLAAQLPGDQSTCVLAVTKSNLGPTPPALGYEFHSDEMGRGRIEWIGPVRCEADDLGLIAPRMLWPRDRAADWLLHQLARGPVPASDILQLAAAASIPERTLNRAKTTANVYSYQVQLENDQRIWYWYDPAAPWPKDAPFPRPESFPPLPYPLHG